MLSEVVTEFGDLSNRPLDSDTKRRLVEASFAAHSSIRIIARETNLKPCTVKKYRYLIAKGVPMFKTHGRPPNLDEVSVRDLVQKIMSHSLTDRITLQYEIREEAKNTYTRRYNTPYEHTRCRVMNRKTVELWRMRILRLVHQLISANNEQYSDTISENL